MQNWMMRSAMAAALVFGLAACESAPKYDPNAATGGSGGRAGDPAMSGTGGRGVSASGLDGAAGSLAEAQRQLTADVGDRVLFDYDSYALKSDGPAILDRQAAFLKRNIQYRIVIEGHSDERGTREYNLALAERRATTVRDYLVNQGIATARISVISYGKERPVATTANESAWAQNRRAVTALGN
jgi:peptidoglycan-associated lipoprotein